jgi:type VI secretion system protein ImpC
MATTPKTPAKGGSGGATPPAGPMLQQFLTQGKLARDPSQVDAAKAMLKEFCNQVANTPKEQIPEDVYTFIVNSVTNIDKQLSTQMDEILHNPDFQRYEGSWRGLHRLVSKTETGEMLKLRLLVVTKDELTKDLEKAVEFDQSALFKKVYEEQYGTYGGTPFSCLIGDYEFGRLPQDVELATLLSNVAAAAHAPFVGAACPSLFNFDSFSDMSAPRDLAKLFDGTDAIKWRALRDSEDSRYFTLTLPHVLSRLPYGQNTVPVDGFDYEETVDGTDNSQFCWGSSAYAMAENITRAFAHYGWVAAIRGTEGGGMVGDLPAYTFKTASGDLAVKCPTEVIITDRREKELSDLGFVALCYCKDTDYATFFGGQTTQKPKMYNLDEANANARLSARLPYMLNCSRFAHYIKVMMRDKIGSFMSRDNVASYLNTWLAQYILLSDIAPQDVKAAFPLREGRVDVFDEPGKPGCYKAVVYLRPFFQLEELTASLRLVAALPKPAA